MAPILNSLASITKQYGITSLASGETVYDPFEVYADLQGGSTSVSATAAAVGNYGTYNTNTSSVSWTQVFDTVGAIGGGAIRRTGDDSLRIYWQMNLAQPWTCEWYHTGTVDTDRLHCAVLCWDDGYNQQGSDPPGASIGYEQRYGSNGIVAKMNGANAGQGAGQPGSVSVSIAPAYIRITHDGSGTIKNYINKSLEATYTTTQHLLSGLRDFVFIIGGTTGGHGMTVSSSTWSAWKSANYANQVTYRTSNGQAAYFKAYAGRDLGTTWPSNFSLQ